MSDYKMLTKSTYLVITYKLYIFFLWIRYKKNRQISLFNSKAISILDDIKVSRRGNIFAYEGSLSHEYIKYMRKKEKFIADKNFIDIAYIF